MTQMRVMQLIRHTVEAAAYVAARDGGPIDGTLGIALDARLCRVAGVTPAEADGAARAVGRLIDAARARGGDPVAALVAVLARIHHPAAYTTAAGEVADRWLADR